MSSISIEKLHDDVEFLKKELSNMKQHMVDEDTVLTEDDHKAIKKYRNEMAQGSLTSLDEFEKELGIED